MPVHVVDGVSVLNSDGGLYSGRMGCCPRRLSEGRGGTTVMMPCNSPFHLVVRGVEAKDLNMDMPFHLVVGVPCLGGQGHASLSTEWLG
jgi:hypothetical protein